MKYLITYNDSYIKKYINGCLIVILLISISGCDIFTFEKYDFKGMVFDEPKLAPEFTLYDQYGELLSLSDLQGKVVLLFFGFTHCPDACPLTLSTWKIVRELLADKADDVVFLMVTVDPERDTGAILKKHLSLFDEEFIGLYGSVDDVKSVARDYNIYIEKVNIESGTGHMINHSTLSYVIDREGYLVLAHRSYEVDPEDIYRDVEAILDRNPILFGGDDNFMILCDQGCAVNLPEVSNEK